MIADSQDSSSPQTSKHRELGIMLRQRRHLGMKARVSKRNQSPTDRPGRHEVEIDTDANAVTTQWMPTRATEPSAGGMGMSMSMSMSASQAACGLDLLVCLSDCEV